ncbi:Multicopper oxidase with three cupredoxin domains (includes cell division protein FtsP and spore coat protein CotA) [Nonomuraea maritima]|uniref:Copper-containing nitrite reductase n=1 Tax=Nonomuraea maritima TaxID=683260 RepID=A0A1G9BN17_9ACTN|nr:Multicopper oxidase with three cupredoxin domains (includes cell division protein FtsP and spore coat protein CotA) [Nonomuraea maritima]
MSEISRRTAIAALAPLAGSAVAAQWTTDSADPERHLHPHTAGSAHAGFAAGTTVDNAANGFHPTALLRDFDRGKSSRLPGGRTLREWTLEAHEKSIEVAPGVTYPAWTYNGRIPGPTLRADEGDRLRITLVNHSSHPHTVHFHGVHAPEVDGVPGIGPGLVQPGGRTVYEFDALPYGLHPYHCHVSPLAPHIAKGLYGALLIDPKQGRPKADEMVMVMNGFDTNFDRANELYAVNTIPFAYMNEPVRVELGELVRIYLVNVLEYDLVNSFHVHGNFFDWYPTGTSLRPVEHTDTVMLCQGQRGILELRFGHRGRFMFHAHQSEFTELGWMGFFEVGSDGGR